MLCSVEPQPIAAEAGDLAMSSGGGSASTAASIEADAALYRAKVDELWIRSARPCAAQPNCSACTAWGVGTAAHGEAAHDKEHSCGW